MVRLGDGLENAIGDSPAVETATTVFVHIYEDIVVGQVQVLLDGLGVQLRE